MRELLEPEAHGPEPLFFRRRTRRDLQPVFDLEVGEVRLHHAEHGAAIFFGRHLATQSDARSDARRRPHIA
jgi:hypothetical protein